MPYSILYGAVEVQYPQWPVEGPWTKLDFTGPVMTSLMVLGLANFGWWALKMFWRGTSGFVNHFRNFGNANKYL